MAKKPKWRQGIVVSREGKPDKPATVDMAESFFDRAALERDPTRRDRLLYQGMLVRMFGRMNKKMVDLKTFRPGRPRGSRLKTVDAPLHAFMEETSATTGETRKYALARLAVVHFNVPEDQRENSMRRLARWWDSRD